jgi:hypothetical protein
MKYCSLHRADGRDVPRRAPQHVFRFDAHRHDDLAATGRFVLDRDHGGFVQNDAALADVNQRIRGSKIY